MHRGLSGSGLIGQSWVCAARVMQPGALLFDEGKKLTSWRISTQFPRWMRSPGTNWEFGRLTPHTILTEEHRLRLILVQYLSTLI